MITGQIYIFLGGFILQNLLVGVGLEARGFIKNNSDSATHMQKLNR